MTVAEHESDLKLTTGTAYIALTGKPWGVCCEKNEKIDRVITVLHCITQREQCLWNYRIDMQRRYLRWQSLVGAKPLSEPMLEYC